MKRAKTCGPVAIQGHAGSFSEAAARAYFSPETQLASQPNFKALFASVEDGSCACGVVPIENSLMGSIHENYDLLLQSDVHIVGEIKLRIVHNLIVNRGVQLADIRYIASQPPALAQCTRFIHSLADAQTIATDDTAGAVKELAASGARDRGAIAGAQARRRVRDGDPRLRHRGRPAQFYALFGSEPVRRASASRASQDHARLCD